MALEISLRRFSLLPTFIQNGNGEPRGAHYLGRSNPELDQNKDQGLKNEGGPGKPGSGKYRPLSDITLGDVDAAYRYFKNQLVQSPVDGWVAQNYFCQVPLKSRLDDERPPSLFGRVKTCYPSDGNLFNVEQMEIYFPRKDASPDVLNIRAGDIARHGLVSSYCLGVRLYVSENEMQDFSRSENIFIEKGYAPLYDTGFGDLIHVEEQNRDSLPWLYVIGSEWFASIPHSLQGEVREQLRRLVHWKKDILNYHPRRYALQVHSLNDELEFNYGFTDDYLLAPQDVKQTLDKLEAVFDTRFMRGMK